MSKTKIMAVAAALAMTGFAAQADTAGLQSTASTTIQLRAFVPVICRVQFSADVGQADENGLVSLGTAKEFCNAPRGYRVLVQHAANLEGAALISDGVRIPLSASGETVLTDAHHADLRSVTLALDPGNEPSQFNSLGVRIEAKS